MEIGQKFKNDENKPLKEQEYYEKSLDSSKDCKENGKKANSAGGGLDYVTLQFPICKFMGASVGLLPYSSVGYAFGNDIVHGTMENQGSGGINEFYLGVAGTFAGLSLGANFSYDFGTIVDDVFANPSTGSSKFEHVMRVRDWNVVIGAQYSFNINLI